MCVAAGTPGGQRRCGWTSINSTTTQPGRQLRGKPLEGLCFMFWALPSHRMAATDVRGDNQSG